MKMKVIKEPVYEKIQVSERDVEMWETDDGRLFSDKEDAENHEFFDLYLNRRELPDLFHNVEILDFNNIGEFKRYEDRYYNPIKYNIENLTFPNTYVFYDVDISGQDDYYPEYLTHCISFKEYKKMIIEQVI